MQELLLKAVACEDHGEELAKVMAVYGEWRDADLQQCKLEPQLSLLQLLPDMMQSVGYDTSGFDIAVLLDFFFIHSEMLVNFYLVRFAHLLSLCLSCLLPTLSASIPSPLRLKAGQDLPAFNHGRGQAQPPHASACPQGMSWWYGHSGGCQLVCGRPQPPAQEFVWEVFKIGPSDEVFVCL